MNPFASIILNTPSDIHNSTFGFEAPKYSLFYEFYNIGINRLLNDAVIR